MRAMGFNAERLPVILFEDDHLLVVNKPAGINTHAPAPFTGEGLYEWLRNREPRWGTLAIVHRLDKETSGILVFAKTAVASEGLVGQFARRLIRKKYVLLTHVPPPRLELAVTSRLVRRGSRFQSASGREAGDLAETQFTLLSAPPGGPVQVIAEPLTGRTHQIRVHASENGFPILGDTLYGGRPAPRVCLHAQQLTLRHPDTGAEQVFSIGTSFPPDSRLLLRQALIDPELTDAYRLAHGAADGPATAGSYIDRLGEFLLWSSTQGGPPPEAVAGTLRWCVQKYRLRGAYRRTLSRHVRGAAPAEASPTCLFGETAPETFVVRENGVQFELSLREGYSVGLFLDQRDNRRRLLVNHVAPDLPVFREGPAGAAVLNTFSYTCAFSVCAALAGAATLSLDLSRKYLEWGRRNFLLNGLDPAGHEFVYGDAFEWLRRLAKKGRVFDLLLLDPPSFSQSRESGVFRAEKDYGELVTAALPLLKPGGVLFASTNAAAVKPGAFIGTIEQRIRLAHRKLLQRHYVPQPPDFPVTREEPAHLKTAWCRVG